MPLHPQAEQYLKRTGRPPQRVPTKVQDTKAGSVPVRVYTPGGIEGALPAMLYFHGGGFSGGSIDSSDTRCRVLAEFSGLVVVNVGYRLAPDNPFPAAVDDAYESTKWVVDNAALLGVNPAKVAVGGDSAGGNLAAVVAHLAKERGVLLAFQYLAYPVVDMTVETASHREFGKGYGLDTSGVCVVYLQGHDASDPRVSPLLNKDFRGLPPAFIATAEYDPLRDEGEAYAKKLQDAGVPVQFKRYAGMVHAFAAAYREFDAAHELALDSARALQKAFG